MASWRTDVRLDFPHLCMQFDCKLPGKERQYNLSFIGSISLDISTKAESIKGQNLLPNNFCSKVVAGFKNMNTGLFQKSFRLHSLNPLFFHNFSNGWVFWINNLNKPDRCNSKLRTTALVSQEEANEAQQMGKRRCNWKERAQIQMSHMLPTYHFIDERIKKTIKQ